MSEPRPRYTITIDRLRRLCPLLASITVGPLDNLIGRSFTGEIVVQTEPYKKVTPGQVTLFQDRYQYAVAKGLIKARPQGEQNG